MLPAHPENECLRCNSPEPVLGSFFCQACIDHFKHPVPAPADQGKPVAKRTGARPPRRIGYANPKG